MRRYPPQPDRVLLTILAALALLGTLWLVWSLWPQSADREAYVLCVSSATYKAGVETQSGINCKTIVRQTPGSRD